MSKIIAIGSTERPSRSAQPRASTQGHHQQHQHHNRGPRARSVSRSSSSPSPPPTSSTNATSIITSIRTARKSFSGSRQSRLQNRDTLGGPGPSTLSYTSQNGHGGQSTSIYPDESPLGDTRGDNAGFSTTYGASASSRGGRSDDEKEHDYFVSLNGEETEKEMVTRRARELKEEIYGDGTPRISTPIPGIGRLSFSGRRPILSHSNIPARPSLLPWQIGHRTHSDQEISKRGSRLLRIGYKITRRTCEDALLLAAVIYGIHVLRTQWDEMAIAGETSLLVALSILYKICRCPPTLSPRSSPPTRPQTPPISTSTQANGHGPHHGNVRERSSRSTSSQGLTAFPLSGTSVGRDELRRSSFTEEDEGNTAVGCIWGTEEREYRECLDDGVLFALLLPPLMACAMLHGSLQHLSTQPASAIPKGWHIEDPLVLQSTPIRRLDGALPLLNDSLRALSALATSRRNLVQLFTLCSFVLLVQLLWSLRLERKLARQTPPMTSGIQVSPALSMEREASESAKHTLSSSYWLRIGGWRRNGKVVGFAFVVTAGCVVVKIATAYIRKGVWSDMSHSDIVIATLFYQFSLYVCVRLARQGFTLGELGVVCSAATALFMETVNLTRMKIRILRTPHIKTYRLPTPLLIFQLALIPGSLLAGFLLSPLLVLSRHLAQKPAHRLRFPHEKPMHRRLLALGFYGGAAIICGGLVGTWTRWCLNWRDPFVWVIFFLIDGKRAWTRPALLAYWGGLAMISVAGWNRQLMRARRHRRYVVPGVREKRESGLSTSARADQQASNGVTAEGGITGVATQMMDAADQRISTLSVNSRRKFFHALAVVMFVPGIAVDPAFTHLSFSVAFAAFNFAEYVRYFALWPFGVSVHLFLNEFLDHKDSGTAILSHFYLLTGCAAPLWLEGNSKVLTYFGVLSLGIGDALASIVGKRVGRVRWSAAGGKTVEGSVAFMGSVLISTILLWAFGAVGNVKPVPYVLATGLSTLLEAFSYQNDNLILPMYGWAIGTLLGT